MKKLAFVLLLSISGCCTGGINSAYLQADKATLVAIGDEYCEYVKNDPKLQGKDEDKQIKLDTVKRWRQRVQYFESGGK